VGAPAPCCGRGAALRAGSSPLTPPSAAAPPGLPSLPAPRPFPADVALDPAGMRAALQHDSSASSLIVKLALHALTAKGPLAATMDVGKREGWAQAARTLCLPRTADALRNE